MAPSLVDVADHFMMVVITQDVTPEQMRRSARTLQIEIEAMIGAVEEFDSRMEMS